MPDQTKPPALLLLGASGVLGATLVNAWGADRVIATHFAHPRPQSQQFDARTDDVKSLWADCPTPPQAAIVMLGITSLDACAKDPVGSAETNVGAVKRVLDQLDASGIPSVFVSSDGVFPGDRSWWEEADTPRPILEYGRQKLQVEQHLLRRPGAMVVRIPKLLEDDAVGTGMLAGWMGALGKPGAILCATDQYFSPASARDVARAILNLTAKRCEGIFHVAGSERCSRRELLGEIMDEYEKFSPVVATVNHCRLVDIPVLEPRPLDTSMRSDRMKAHLGFALRGATEVARAAVRQHFRQLS